MQVKAMTELYVVVVVVVVGQYAALERRSAALKATMEGRVSELEEKLEEQGATDTAGEVSRLSFSLSICPSLSVFLLCYFSL